MSDTLAFITHGRNPLASEGERVSVPTQAAPPVLSDDQVIAFLRKFGFPHPYSGYREVQLEWAQDVLTFHIDQTREDIDLACVVIDYFRPGYIWETLVELTRDQLALNDAEANFRPGEIPTMDPPEQEDMETTTFWAWILAIFGVVSIIVVSILRTIGWL